MFTNSQAHCNDIWKNKEKLSENAVTQSSASLQHRWLSIGDGGLRGEGGILLTRSNACGDLACDLQTSRDHTAPMILDTQLQMIKLQGAKQPPIPFVDITTDWSIEMTNFACKHDPFGVYVMATAPPQHGMRMLAFDIEQIISMWMHFNQPYFDDKFA